MAAPYNPPIKGQDFVIYIALADMNSPGSFKSNPTLAAGDFTVSKDGGSFTALDTTPDVDPNSGIAVKVSLTATEMDADSVVIAGIDQTAPKEWADFCMSIPTTSA